MQHVTFTLRTLTPLFLAGADGTKAELRAPTFRGLMRYWYRALVSGMVSWLLTHLVCTDSRSRRCAGSVTTIVTKAEATLPSDIRFDTPVSVVALQKQIADGVHITEALTLKKRGQHCE